MPTIVNGWAAKMLNTIAAIADENKDSLIPKNWPVRRYMSSVYAIAGRTLCWLVVSLGMGRGGRK